MPKAIENDYADELKQQMDAWNRKDGLRSVYKNWYQRIVDVLSDKGPVVEIGSGCGNFKEFYPQVVATDVIPTGPWIDEIVDARCLPFQPSSIGNFILIDCLHHLPRPIRFLRSAMEALAVGGRIVLLEPAITPWSRIVWKTCHHEPVDLSVDLFNQWDTPEPDNPGFCYANMATAHLLFQRDRERLCQLLPNAEITKIEWSDMFVYPATGGFSYFSLLPSAVIAALHPLERRWMPNRIARLVGLRMLVVIQKIEGNNRP